MQAFRDCDLVDLAERCRKLARQVPLVEAEMCEEAAKSFSLAAKAIKDNNPIDFKFYSAQGCLDLRAGRLNVFYSQRRKPYDDLISQVYDIMN